MPHPQTDGSRGTVAQGPNSHREWGRWSGRAPCRPSSGAGAPSSGWSPGPASQASQSCAVHSPWGVGTRSTAAGCQAAAARALAAAASAAATSAGRSTPASAAASRATASSPGAAGSGAGAGAGGRREVSRPVGPARSRWAGCAVLGMGLTYQVPSAAWAHHQSGGGALGRTSKAAHAGSRAACTTRSPSTTSGVRGAPCAARLTSLR